MALVRLSAALLAAAALALGAGPMVRAQGGDAAPDDRGSFEVAGIQVDVSGRNANAARMGGWRLAQRKAWSQLSQRLTGKPGSLSDGALDAIVTGIVVEQEQIGPNRYIARLGVLFDRGRAGAILGVSTAVSRSAPMLLVPVEYAGGAGQAFERDTDWQRAWARFRTGATSIDYVRPRGTGPDALLVNAGQIGRRGRGWWRAVLDQYGASDILVAEVLLRREYPGGPAVAVFTGSHGPDKRRVTQFALRVDESTSLDGLFDEGVRRIDQAFQDALRAGALKSDRLLAYRPPAAEAETTEEETVEEASPTGAPSPAETITTYTVQVETPSAASVTSSESAVRGLPGVRSANTTSLALGGISVMRVTYDGPIGSLAAALSARGWQVQEGPGVLRIRRPTPRNAPGAGSETEAPSNE